MKVKKILCVCDGNTCRSPMLQALLSRELKNRGVEAVVESAGMFEVDVPVPANEKAVICMKERGLDIIEHRSRQVFDLNLSSYDIVLCVSGLGIAQILVGMGVPSDKIKFVVAGDPYGGDIETYRTCAEILANAAVKIADKMTN